MSRDPYLSFSVTRFNSITSALARLLLYSGVVAFLSALLIYVPSYFRLELLTGENASLILQSIGYDAAVKIVGNSVLMGNFELTRECAGVQAFVPLSVAFLLMPRTPNRQRLLAALAVVVSIYLANLARIVLEFAMYDLGVLPWYTIHNFFGFGFSMFTVVLALFFASSLIHLNNITAIASRFNT